MPAESGMTYVFAMASLVIGAGAGAAELLPRYRDEPFRTVARAPALVYLLVNGVLALAAYALLRTYDEIVPLVKGDMLAASMVAGFGSMAVFRARLFTISSPEGSEVRVGPDAAVTALLNALDSAIDRHRAQRRLDIAVAEVKALPMGKVESSWDETVAFLEASIGAFQHLDDAGKRELKAAPAKLAERRDQKQIQLIVMSWALLNAGGEGPYKKTMKHLSDYVNERP